MKYDQTFYTLTKTLDESHGPALTAIDLFSGAGGIALGLQNAGFKVALCSDINEACAKTHEHNLPDVPFHLGDVRELSGELIRQSTGLSVGELDLLVGGPPCQGFSIIGARDPDDPRNGLFREFMRIATDLQPKALVIENVPGLATLSKGQVLDEIGTAFASAGYNVACAELVAAQYGVPQMRWRMIFIGWRKDLGIENAGFPRPTHGSSGIGDLFPNRTITAEELKGFLTTADAIQDLPPVAAGARTVEAYAGAPTRAYQVAMRAGLSDELFNHYAADISDATIERIRALRQGQDWRDLPNELLPAGMRRALRKDHTRRYRRMCWEGVPRSIITRFRDPKSGEYTHPEQDRTITIREAARIQSFPDWFRFLGSHTEQYDQVGNAVPPLLARALGKEIRAVLLGQSQNQQRAPKSRYRVNASRQPSLFPDTL